MLQFHTFKDAYLVFHTGPPCSHSGQYVGLLWAFFFFVIKKTPFAYRAFLDLPRQTSLMDPRISVPSFFMGKLRELNLFIFEFGEWKFGEAGVFLIRHAHSSTVPESFYCHLSPSQTSFPGAHLMESGCCAPVGWNWASPFSSPKTQAC